MLIHVFKKLWYEELSQFFYINLIIQHNLKLFPTQITILKNILNTHVSGRR